MVVGSNWVRPDRFCDSLLSDHFTATDGIDQWLPGAAPLGVGRWAPSAQERSRRHLKSIVVVELDPQKPAENLLSAHFQKVGKCADG